LQHVAIQGQVSDELLQAAILFLELPQPPQLGDAHASKLALPAREGLLTDAQLPTDLQHRCARFCLA
jgi:hypothetical protein